MSQRVSNFDLARYADHLAPVTRLGMGCWVAGGHGWGEVNDEDSISAIRYAFERGVTSFDTADVYGLGKSETLLRQALGPRIKSVFFSTKGGVRWDDAKKTWNDSSAKYLRQAAEASLRRLGVEQIPLYYIHKPDQKTPVAETMEALFALRKSGKIGEIGISNFSCAQFAEALQLGPVCANQVRLNLLERAEAQEVLSLCEHHHVRIVAWCALGDGLLTGKFNRNTTFGGDDHRSWSPAFQGERFLESLRKVEKVRSIANKREVSPAQVALRWVLDRFDCTSPLFGAKTPKQVEENLGVAGWRLSPEELAELEDL